jgi:hypothetical protein
MAVMIGVDPQKRSHTAVAVDDREAELERVEVRASRVQVDELLAWASKCCSMRASRSRRSRSTWVTLTLASRCGRTRA